MLTVTFFWNVYFFNPKLYVKCMKARKTANKVKWHDNKTSKRVKKLTVRKH